MRQLRTLTILVLSFLVCGLAHAADNGGGVDNHGSGGGQNGHVGGGGDRGGGHPDQANVVNSKDLYKDEKKLAKLEQAERDAYKKAYDALTADQKTDFGNIVQAAAEANTPINKEQLLGFEEFIAAHSDATCVVQKITMKDRGTHFSVLTGKEEQKLHELKSEIRNSQGGGGSSPHGGDKMGLMCTSGTTKQWFSGLAATVLNQYHNANILLANEPTTTAPTTPTPVVASTAPPTPATTTVTGYGAQSANDLKKSPDSDGSMVFESTSVQKSNSSDSGMVFAPGASKSVK